MWQATTRTRRDAQRQGNDTKLNKAIVKESDRVSQEMFIALLSMDLLSVDGTIGMKIFFPSMGPRLSAFFHHLSSFKVGAVRRHNSKPPVTQPFRNFDRPTSDSGSQFVVYPISFGQSRDFSIP
jgi:hypothetical protein